MSEAEDRFDRLERRYEERQRAAQDLAGMLGLGEDNVVPPDGAEKPRDEGGRFVVGTADAGEKGAAVMPTPSMGQWIMALLDDDPSYLDGR
jgi:hypothetical protein